LHLHGQSAALRTFALLAALTTACQDDDPSTCAERLGELCDAPQRYISFAVDVGDAVSADLDDDGRAEVVILSRDSRSVTVSREGGQADTLWLGGDLLHIASGDLDGDGAVDIAISADNPPRLIPLFNREGVLTEGEAIELEFEPTALATADLNGDGIAEFLIGHRGGLTQLRGDLDPDEGLAGHTPVAMKVADLDGDGAVDVAVVDFEGSSLELLRGDGTGGLSPMASIPVGLASEDLDLADINGDGALDIIVRSRLDASLWIIEADGMGGFMPPWLLEIGGAPTLGRGVVAFPTEGSDLFSVATPGTLMQVTVSDGGPEPIGRANLQGYSEATLVGDGFVSGLGLLYEYEISPSPSPLVVDSLPGGTALAAADIDGDGYDDLLRQTRLVHACTLAIHWGGPDGLDEEATPLGPESSRAGGCPEHIVLADINGDGRIDLLASGGIDLETPLRSWIAVGLGLGDGTFELLPLSLLTSSTQAPPTVLERPDGALLIIPQGAEADGAALVEVDAAGALTPLPTLADDRAVWSAVAGDVDGDLQADLVLRTGVDDPQLEVYYGGELHTGPRYAAAQLGLSTDESVTWGTHCALADVDDDGASEVLLSTYDDTTESSTIVLVGDLDGAPQLLETRDYDAYLNSPSFFADLDGDGDLDVTLWGLQGPSVIHRDAQGLQETLRSLTLGLSPRDAAADFNGDGSVDIAAMTVSRTQVIESREVSLPNPTRYRPLPGGIRSDRFSFAGLVHTVHGDGDGDGQEDMMLGAHTQLTTAWGDGGDFARATTHPLGIGRIFDLASVDLDGDGDVELVALATEENTYSVHLLDWQEDRWQNLDTIEGTTTGYGIALNVDDLDDDGIVDIAVAATTDTTLSVHVIYGRLAGVGPLDSLVFDRSVTTTAAISSHVHLGSLVIDELLLQSADLDGDGLKELLLSGGQQRNLLLWNDPERRWRAQRLPYVSSTIVGVGDLVAIRDKALIRVPVVDRALGRAVRIGTSQHNRVYTVDDCDGDGRDDLVTFPDISPAKLWLARGDTFVPFEELRSRSHIGAQSLRCRDLDDDGVIDIVGSTDLGVIAWVSGAE